MDEPYIPLDLTLINPTAAREIHQFFQFKYKDTFEGRLCVETRSSANTFSMYVRSDDVSREFIYNFGGKTLFQEMFYNCNPHELGSKTTTIVFPVLPERKRNGELVRNCIKVEDALLLSPFGKPKATWLNGREAEDTLETHWVLAKHTIQILRDNMEDLSSCIKGRLKVEEEVLASIIRNGGSPSIVDGFNKLGVKAKEPNLANIRWLYTPSLNLG